MCITTYRDNTHWAILANQCNPGNWVCYVEGHLTNTYRLFNPKTKNIILIQAVIFLQKSYGEHTKVEKPVLLTMSNERSDDDEELKTVKTVPVINNDNICNLDSDSDSDNDIKNDDQNFFNEDIDDEVKAIPKTTINAKMVHAIKNSKLCTTTMSTKSSSKLQKKKMPSKI